MEEQTKTENKDSNILTPKEKLLKVLREISRSSEIIKIEENKNRFIFNDKRAIEYFSDSKRGGALNPFNDFTYGWVDSFISQSIDYIQTLEDDLSDYDLEGFGDARHEFIDGLVNPYNNDLLKWLSSHLSNASYVEEAVEEFGLDTNNFNFWNLLQQGQYRHIEDVLSIFEIQLESLKDEILSESTEVQE